MRLQSVDTPADVEAVLIARFRDMGPLGRLRAAVALNRDLDALAAAGIRLRHGDIGEHELRLRLFALRLDRDDMVRAFGWDPGREGY
jgi:hypothetical protein